VGTPIWEVLGQVIAIDDPSTWPSSVYEAAERLAALVAAHPEFRSDYATSDLGRLGVPHDTDASFRAVLEEHPVQMFHATRLLSTERDGLVRDGLRRLDEALCRDRLDGVLRHHPGLLTSVEADDLLANGQLEARHSGVRRGLLWFAAPWDAIEPGFADIWGGEAIGWTTADPEGRREQAIDRLTQASIPTVVEASVDVAWLDPLGSSLWVQFAGVLLGTPDIGNHWAVTNAPSVPVLDLITPGHPRWDPAWDGPLEMEI
jgi:hypothetical protein